MIPVYKPYLTPKILQKAHDALDSGWLSAGQHVQNVERILSALHYKPVVSCCNGTAATHLVAKLLKKVHPKVTKIIVPNNVYVAAWNAFLYDSEFELLAVDADGDTWNVNQEALYEAISAHDHETTALLVVHNLGNVVNVPKIKIDWPNLLIVEDNCEGFFGKYGRSRTGSKSFAASISFFGNKNITCGEGGAVIAPHQHYKDVIKMRGQGQTDVRFIHDILGYNYRMTNIQAAILEGQLDCFTDMVDKKANIFNMYKELFNEVPEVLMQKEDPDTTHANWMFGIRIKGAEYSDVSKFLEKNYIESRPMFYPIHTHKHLTHIPEYKATSEVAETLNRECVILPSYPELKEHEMCHIVNTIKSYIVKMK